MLSSLNTRDENVSASSFKAALLKELKGNKELIKMGDGGSSSGSDDCPSEDNLGLEEINKLIPFEKKLKGIQYM